MYCCFFCITLFFFNDTATTEIYTLSLHDALPILVSVRCHLVSAPRGPTCQHLLPLAPQPSSAPRGTYCLTALQAAVRNLDRKSTRLNSSHANISYAVFCLKKKKNNIIHAQNYTKD